MRGERGGQIAGDLQLWLLQDGRFRLVNYNVLSPYLANIASYPSVGAALLDRNYRYKAVTDKVRGPGDRVVVGLAQCAREWLVRLASQWRRQSF